MKITGYVLINLDRFWLFLQLNTNLQTQFTLVHGWYVHTYITHGNINEKSNWHEEDYDVSKCQGIWNPKGGTKYFILELPKTYEQNWYFLEKLFQATKGI